MRRVRSRRDAAVPGLPLRPAADRAAALRALRAADGVAGAPLPRGLAEALAREWQLPLVASVRRRAAKRQRGLSRAERRRNVAGVFAARGEVPRSLVLVDDVLTSGATANAAASALRKAGAHRVEVVTFARVVR